MVADFHAGQGIPADQVIGKGVCIYFQICSARFGEFVSFQLLFPEDVFVPKKEMSEAEKKELYCTRLDETYRSYTVIGVIKKIFRRDFSDDLLQYIGEHPEEFSTTSDEWRVSRSWVNDLTVIHPESVFGQPAERVFVDILIGTKIKLEEVKRGKAGLPYRYSVKPRLRLRYCLDILPTPLWHAQNAGEREW